MNVFYVETEVHLVNTDIVAVAILIRRAFCTNTLKGLSQTLVCLHLGSPGFESHLYRQYMTDFDSRYQTHRGLCISVSTWSEKVSDK